MKRPRNTRNRTRVVGAMWETGETSAEEEKHVDKKGRVGSVATDPDTLENSKEAGKEAQGTQGLRKNCTSRECVPFVASDQRFS